MIERQGASLLTSVGRKEWIAADADDYVAIALALAKEGVRDRARRLELHRDVAASPLGAEDTVIADLETAYMDMYHERMADGRQQAEEKLQQAITLHQSGNLSAATACYDATLELDPDSATAHCNRAIALATLGRLDEAVAGYKSAIAVNPDYGLAYSNMGSALIAQNRIAAARKALERAVAINSKMPEAWHNLGIAHTADGRLAAAATCYEKAIALRPDNAESQNNLGIVLADLGQNSAAIACYEKAIALNPDYANAYNNLGLALAQAGDGDNSIANFKLAIAKKADFAEAFSNMGNILKNLGRISEAAVCYEKSLGITPDCDETLSNLAAVGMELGHFAKAAAYMEQAVNLKPKQLKTRSNLLLQAQYTPGQTMENLKSLHQKWATGFRPDPPIIPFTHEKPQGRPRPLNVGLVSPDLGRHPVGYFLMGFLKHRPKNRLRITCYSDRVPDDYTVELQKHADCWVFSKAMSDSELARRIHDDKMDILIDLAGHSARNRLAVFMAKPAPVQVSWIGYVGTTGVSAIDWLIADRHHVPSGDEEYYTEKIIRLPNSWLCYSAPEYALRVEQRSYSADKRQVIGNFGAPAKINDAMLFTWSQILKRAPQAELLLIYRGMDDPAIIRRISGHFTAAGIDASRLRFVGKLPHRELLARYNSLDLALDTLPYSGGLTTMEALWMGVPVVTAYGNTFAGRHTSSFLRTLGLGELVADSLEGYVEIAVELLENPQRLHEKRDGLRKRVASSPLCDYEGFATVVSGELEKIFDAWTEIGDNRHDDNRANLKLAGSDG